MADISKIDNGTEYNLKDATARAGIESSKTIKSSVVTVPDAAPINAEDITVDITPQQDLHGYDRPWAGGTWKNKCPFDNFSFTSVNTWCSLVGEPAVNLLDGSPVILKSGTYYAKLTDSINIDNMQIADSSGNLILNSVGGSFTLSSDDTVYIRVKQINRSTATSSKLQIELGNQATTFAPYSNICPIEGWTGAELDRLGKNWFDKNANNTSKGYKDNTYLYYNNVEGSAEGWYISEYIRVPSIGSITLSGGRGNDPALCFYDADKHYISGVAYSSIMPKTFSIPSNSAYIRLSVPKNLKNTLQLELGSTATAYEPYQGKQYTANFGETVYGCTVDFNTGKVVVTHAYELYDGSDDEGWSENYGLMMLTRDTALYRAGYKTIISNLFESLADTVEWATVSKGKIVVTKNSNNIRMIMVNHATDLESVETLSEYKAFLASNNLQICYELANPYTLTLTPTQLKMLKGTNTLTSNGATITLKYQPDNVIGELKGEIQKANSFVSKMALREGSGAKDFSYGGWSFRLYIYRSMGQISMSVERISASSVTEQAVVKVFNGESDYRAPEELRPRLNLMQAATYTTPSGWAIQVYLKDDGYIMFTGMAPAVGASAPTSSNWNLVEPWLVHQQAKDLFNN